MKIKFHKYNKEYITFLIIRLFIYVVEEDLTNEISL